MRKAPIMTYEEFKEKVGSVILTDDGNCPVTPVVQMLQGKWKLQILYELCIKCPMRFGELKADELVQRIQYNEMPLRVEYSLTEKGRDLLPVFYAISVGYEVYPLNKLSLRIPSKYKSCRNGLMICQIIPLF